MDKIPALARLKPLAGPRQRGLEPGFKRLAKTARGLRRQAVVQFRVVEGARTHSWAVDLGTAGAAPRREELAGANLYIVVRASTWRAIAQGSLSPIDAFMRGQLRIGGDVELARELLSKLVDKRSGVVHLC